MSRTITIKNLKNIQELTLEMPRPGIHLLSGTNGSGKTTILACLRRIGQANAFPTHFRTSQYSQYLDSFSRAEITYTLDDESVTYAYAGERWVPRPRKASRLVESFGYPEVFYAGATAERINPRDEDFRLARMNPASMSIKEAANEIFETDRFSHLRTINLKRGKGNQAFVLAPPMPGQRQHYISEKNFSLGELCVLKLLRELTQCSRGSLVLIDELELALHPRAQIGLLNYLERVAFEKALTVIVSTHSVTLLKKTPRKKLMFLEQRDDETVLLAGCFPAYALGTLSFQEERTPDIVVYVEDEAARSVTDSLLKLAIADRYPAGENVFPTARVVPVGDFKQVVRFYDQNRMMLPDLVKQWIVLDHDVESESLDIMAAQSHSPMRDLFHEHQAYIRYLPWSPELGLIEFLTANRIRIQQHLRMSLTNAHINITANMIALSGTTQAARRSESKVRVKDLVAELCEQVGGNIKEEAMAHDLFALFAKEYFRSHRAAAMQLLGPLVA